MQLEKSMCSIDDLIREVVNDVQVFTRAKHVITFKKFSKTQLRLDKYRISQVLANLLTNAIKYSPKSSEIIVTARRKNDTIIVEVKDSGMGIPKDKQHEVFQRFFRVNPNQYNSGGFTSLGLGLYISAEIIKRHEGKIWVKSKEGKGSTFYFSLPINGV